MMLSVVVFLMNLILHWFLINLILAVGALVFILKNNRGLFQYLMKGER